MSGPVYPYLSDREFRNRAWQFFACRTFTRRANGLIEQRVSGIPARSRKSKRRDPHAKARAAMIKAHSTPNALLGRLKP